MQDHSHSFTLNSPDETQDLAQKIGEILTAGDVILLQGDIGAGKSFFARALIQSHQTHPEDVPSPTFTLVQTYDTNIGEIWHADLYRLSGPEDIIELGLADAFETAICLIEWPDRLGDMTPPHAITLTFTLGENDDARIVNIAPTTPDWTNRLNRILP